MSAGFGGVPVVRSDLLPPGTILLISPEAFRLLEPEVPVAVWRPRTFVGEIRELVRDRMQQAFPDLILPPRRPEPRTDLERIRAEMMMGMQVLDPAALVRGTVTA